MQTSSSNIYYNVIDSFEHNKLDCETWNKLLPDSATNEIFQTWQYQSTWWNSFGRGQLMLVTVSYEDTIKAILPFFEDSSMLYLVGSGGSDYLDVIGNFSVREFTEAWLFATKKVKNYSGTVFYHLKESSRTTSLIKEAAHKAGWYVHCENVQKAPILEINLHPEFSLEASNKKSLKRHLNWFQNNGILKVEHFSDYNSVSPYLNKFFGQHVERWSSTQYPSMFLNETQKLFYRKLISELDHTGWILFTKIEWNKYDIAYHFGFTYNSKFFWYKPTFNTIYAKQSPGEVLLKELLTYALNNNFQYFDFGLGEEKFKDRFATNKETVYDWGVYPEKIKR